MNKIKIGFVNKFIERMYNDKIEIHRFQKIKQPNGVTTRDTIMLGTFEGKLSFGQNDDIHRETQFLTTGNLPVKLFVPITVPVKKGDLVIAHRLSDDGEVMETYTGTVNRPNVYTSHKEVAFADVRNA